MSRRAIIAALLIAASFLTVQCTQSPEAPFFDGLYLKYKLTNTSKTRYDDMLESEGNVRNYAVTYSFERSGERYRVLMSEVEPRSLRTYGEEEFILDSRGMIRESANSDENGNYSRIWLPAAGLERGDRIQDTLAVDRKGKWKQWDVIVVMDVLTPVFERYYDIKTGLLVGEQTRFGVKGMGSRQSMSTLADTNANGLVLE